jgi:hypothetical protein
MDRRIERTFPSAAEGLSTATQRVQEAYLVRSIGRRSVLYRVQLAATLGDHHHVQHGSL